MSKRIEVSWGGGSNTLLLSLATATLYSYEDDCEVVHKRYGGKCYYSSRSGMSGAGYLIPEEGEMGVNDLFFPFAFRTDAWRGVLLWGQGTPGLGVVKKDDSVFTRPRPVVVFVAYISHGGVDYGCPAVVSDGCNVAFARAHAGEGGFRPVMDVIKKWESLEFSPKELVFFNASGDKEVKNWGFHNPERLGGLDAIRFVDLSGAVVPPEELVNVEDHPLFNKKIGLVQLENRYRYRGGDCYRFFHQNRYGILDEDLGGDPYYWDEDIPNGWKCVSGHIFSRRHGDSVEAFMEIPRKDVGEKYAREGLPAYVDYEESFSTFDWFTQSTQEKSAHFERKILKKAREDLVFWAQQQRCAATEREAQGDASRDDASAHGCASEHGRLPGDGQLYVLAEYLPDNIANHSNSSSDDEFVEIE